MDMRTGKAFTECEKMAFAYFDQNEWCDEKEHIWEKVRKGMASFQGADDNELPVEGTNVEEVEENGKRMKNEEVTEEDDRGM